MCASRSARRLTFSQGPKSEPLLFPVHPGRHGWASRFELASSIKVSTDQGKIKSRRLVWFAIEAALFACRLRRKRCETHKQVCPLADTSSLWDPVLNRFVPVGCAPCVSRFPLLCDAAPPRVHAYVACPRPAGLSLPSPSPSCSAHAISTPSLVTSFGGLDLHLSSRSDTGYANVSLKKGASLKPYRAKAPGGKLLGSFATALEAAVCYAQHISASCASDVLSEARTPDGEVIQLHLSTRSPTRYFGVRRIPSRVLAKPLIARLGPSAADFVGYFGTVLDAAVAVALAMRARDNLVGLQLACLDEAVAADATAGSDLDGAMHATLSEVHRTL